MDLRSVIANNHSTTRSHRPIRLTQCCTQFRSLGVKVLCVFYLHDNIAFTFKWYGNTWNKKFYSQRIWIVYNIELAESVYYIQFERLIKLSLIINWLRKKARCTSFYGYFQREGNATCHHGWAVEWLVTRQFMIKKVADSEINVFWTLYLVWLNWNHVRLEKVSVTSKSWWTCRECVDVLVNKLLIS